LTGPGEKSCASQNKIAEEPKKSKAETSEAFGGLRNLSTRRRHVLVNLYCGIISPQKGKGEREKSAKTKVHVNLLHWLKLRLPSRFPMRGNPENGVPTS
jgi:hypothetical protein